MSYLRRRYILLEKLQDSLRGSGEGGGGLRTLWEHHYMIIIRMMLRNRTSVPLVLLISDYRREMTRFNRAPKKKIQSNLKFSSK